MGNNGYNLDIYVLTENGEKIPLRTAEVKALTPSSEWWECDNCDTCEACDGKKHEESKESADPKVKRHEVVCQMLHDTYVAKNHDYGDSFGESFKEFGLISALTRISDKFNRFKNLVMSPVSLVTDEALEDTLLDMANYCIMTYLELKEED